MSLKTTYLTLLKLVFMMTIISVRQATSVCQIFASVIKVARKIVSKHLYLVITYTKNIFLLPLKIMMNIIEETQNIILKVYNCFVETALNSKENDLQTKNIETTESDMKSSERASKSKSNNLIGDIGIENIQYFRIPDIAISNLKFNTTVILELKIRGLDSDEQEAVNAEQFFPTFSKNYNQSEISLSSSLSNSQNIETDLNAEYQTSENQSTPATKDSKLPILLETKSVNEGGFFNLTDEFSTILRNGELNESENYSWSKSESLFKYFNPSVISMATKQNSSFDSNESESELHSCNFTTEEDDTEMSKYDVYKENLRRNLNKDSIELLRRHKLIPNSKTDDSSDESTFDSINAMNSETLTNEVKNEIFESNDDLKSSERLKKDCYSKKYCEVNKKLDLETYLKDHSELHDKNIQESCRGFNTENSSEISKTVSTSTFKEKRTDAKVDPELSRNKEKSSGVN